MSQQAAHLCTQLGSVKRVACQHCPGLRLLAGRLLRLRLEPEGRKAVPALYVELHATARQCQSLVQGCQLCQLGLASTTVSAKLAGTWP